MAYYKDSNNHVYYEDKNGVVHKTNLISAHSDDKTKSFGSKAAYREYSSKKKNPESFNNSHKFSIKNLLFGLSATLFLLAYFFIGAVPEEILHTKVETNVSNTINGVDYDYQVNYVDYDYTKKIEQLSDFENIFDFGLISAAGSTNLIEYGVDEWDVSDYPSVVVGIMSEDIFISTYEYLDVDNNITTINYLNWSPIYDAVILFTPGFTDELKAFVNKRNYKDYANLKYGINLESNVADKVSYYAYRLFILLSAPLDWLGNFMYDLGVLSRFIFVW